MSTPSASPAGTPSVPGEGQPPPGG
jgi:hypothetical protein